MLYYSWLKFSFENGNLLSLLASNVSLTKAHCYFNFYSTLGQGLLTSTYPGEVLFSILIAISGLLLFALLIGNMQVSFILHFISAS